MAEHRGPVQEGEKQREDISRENSSPNLSADQVGCDLQREERPRAIFEHVDWIVALN